MNNSINNILKYMLSYCIKYKIYFILLLIVLFNIRERKNNGQDRIIFSKAKDKITILALDSKRYRGDLDVLAKNNKFRVLHMTQRAPGWLIKSFYKDNDLKKYINSKKGSIESINHNNALKFMIDFLRYFYSYISIDCVTTVNYRYIEDYNWSKASNIIGVPFTMMFRECLLSADRIYDEVYLRTRDRFGSFHGEHIIVHNQVAKRLFVNSGYCCEKRVSVGGALRMDEFLRTIRGDTQRNTKHNKRIKFTLFYFPHNVSVFGFNGSNVPSEKYEYHTREWKYRDKLFIDLHKTIIELAHANPNIDFVIKPKLDMMRNKSWDFYEDVVKKSSINVSNLNNYKVLPIENVHKLIMESDIICAFQSSTALESAIAKKRVIFPLFYQFLDTPYLDSFSWGKYIDVFDVASSASHFKELFYDIINNPCVDSNIMKERVKLFEKYFDSYDGVALEKYSNIIERVVEAG